MNGQRPKAVVYRLEQPPSAVNGLQATARIWALPFNGRYLRGSDSFEGSAPWLKSEARRGQRTAHQHDEMEGSPRKLVYGNERASRTDQLGDELEKSYPVIVSENRIRFPPTQVIGFKQLKIGRHWIRTSDFHRVRMAL